MTEPISGTPHSRRTFLTLAGGGAVAGTAFVVGVTTSPVAQAAGPDSPRPARQFRAMWIASVVNIDWPSATGLSAEAQKAEYVAWLDLARRLNLNAVISQVRPTADAFWPSPYEPWSLWLTGSQGVSPGYDPLAFQVAEAHKRNLEYHAWFNPYRVSMRTDGTDLVPTHPAKVHPDWVWAYGGKLYYDPGIPEVRRFVEDAICHAVTHYDIDAVHFDDYFYPYPSGTTPYPDEQTYARYGGGVPVADWRRENVNSLVREMHERIHAIKPWVKFGISPFGIWRNQANDPRGSQTSGTESYVAISADTRRWVKEGWVDYINPQIYWQIGLTVADYSKLVPWWAEVVRGTDVALYIGQAAYKLTSGAFTDPAELVRHLELNEQYDEVDGDVYFSAKDVRSDPKGAISAVRADRYASPALVPVIPSMGGSAPAAPLAVVVDALSDGVRVYWNRVYRGNATSYAVWKVSGPRATSAELTDGRNLLATVRGTSSLIQSVKIPAASGGDQKAWYAVTAYDRLWNSSRPSFGARAWF